MTEQRDALQLRTQIEQYWIHDVEYYGADTITYRAEDMRLNREVWLHEYFPEGIARRYVKEDGIGTVYAHPTQSEEFAAGKARQQATYDALAGAEHPALPSLLEGFESGGTFYTATRYRSDTMTFRRLYNTGKFFSEQQIGLFVTSLLSALILLQRRQLQLRSLDSDTLLIDTDTKEGILAYAEYMPFEEAGVQQTIHALGVLLHGMISENQSAAGTPLEPLQPDAECSVALCSLVNRMVSSDVSERPKSYAELQNLFQSLLPEVTVYQAPEKERGGNIFSTVARMASVVVILLFASYVLNQPKNMQAEELTRFDAARFHLVAYFGSAEAQRALGQMYEKGYGVEPDMNEAVKWYTKAAEQGNAYAQLSLGLFNSEGRGLPKNAEKALYWYYQAAEQGNATAQYNIGHCYLNGIGVAKNEKEAVRWLEKAAAQEMKEAKAYLAALKQGRERIVSPATGILAQRSLAYQKLYGSDEKDFQGAFEIYSRLAEGGDRNSQSHLGYIYMTGKGIKLDYNQAMYWFKKAVAQGDAYSCGAIGKMYRFGQGVPQNNTEAKYWFELGAKRGDDYSVKKLREMATLSDSGRQVPKNGFDEEKSVITVVEQDLAFAQRGDSKAQYRLGEYYRKGSGVEKSYADALKWYRMSAQQGYAPAQNELGKMYRYGKGVAEDFDQAYEWYRKAAYQGNTDAAYNIGLLYSQGFGETRSCNKESIEWFRKAADKNHAKAQYYLGKAYEMGCGVTRKYRTAKYWYERSASQGYRSAISRLKTLPRTPS